ncbi:hypothetical protein HK102_007588 [Quaeritorhiza haematococci]|nr:hypothetical protein HK102_007588 [Quaeritorhiza haematococci]
MPDPPPTYSSAFEAAKAEEEARGKHKRAFAIDFAMQADPSLDTSEGEKPKVGPVKQASAWIAKHSLDPYR